MQFLNKAKLQFEFKDKHGVKWYSLKENLYLYLGDEVVSKTMTIDKKDLIVVPKETFMTDLASVPKLLHWIYKPNGKYTRASIVHDLLYSQREIKRGYADKTFRKAMKLDSVNWFTRWLFWCAVRIGGKSHKA